MRFIQVIALIIFLTLPLTASALECKPHKEAVLILMHNGYAWHATAVTEQHYTLQVFINMKTRDWVFLMIDNDLNACIVASGYYWGFPIERAI